MNEAPLFSRSRRALAIVLALFVAVWLANLDVRKLIKSDEGRYAEIAREMVATGDWITPRYNDLKYFYKPPLQYWATAAAYEAFGVDEWTARLWTALTGLATVLFTGFFAARLFGRDVGIAAAVVSGSSLMIVALGHLLTLDMSLACFMTLTLGAFLLAEREAADAGARRRWMLVAWAGMALGVLSKGLPALVLPGGVLFVHLLWQRDWALLRRLELLRGLALFLLIAAPWFVAVSLANPEFPRYFFWHEHVERFLTKVHGRYEPWWYFIPVLALGFVPWTLALVPAVARGWRADPERRDQPQRVLWLWAVLIYLFFSASSSKLASYLVPIAPALAVLVALQLPRLSRRAWVAMLAPMLVLGAVLPVLAPWAERFASREITPDMLAGLAPWAAISGAALVAGAAAGLLLDARGRRGAAILAVGAGGLLFTQGLLTGHNALAPAQSSAHLAAQVRPLLTPGVPFYSVGYYDHTLNFYLERTVTLVVEKNEHEFGISQEPWKFIPSYEEFAQRWAADPAAFAITTPDYYRRVVEPSGLPRERVAADTRRIVFRKPAPGAPGGPPAR